MKLISHTRHYMPNVNLKKTYNIMRLSVVLCMLRSHPVWVRGLKQFTV